LRLTGFGKLKNPMTSLVIEPNTLWISVQHLNQPSCCQIKLGWIRTILKVRQMVEENLNGPEQDR
jgi:hypothetical protein